MSDTTTPSARAETPDAPEPVENPAAAEAARQARKYRQQLRATEAERDQLRAQVESFQRAEVERLAADRMADPADLWRAGINLGDLLTEDGAIDTQRVTETVDQVLSTHRHWRKTASAAAPASEVGATGRINTDDAPASFEDAFRPRRD